MLEKACLAVEGAAKGGGVYPEVLFMVAKKWCVLAEEELGEEGAAVAAANVANQRHRSSALVEPRAGVVANPPQQQQQQIQQQQLPYQLPVSTSAPPPIRGHHHMMPPSSVMQPLPGNLNAPPPLSGRANSYALHPSAAGSLNLGGLAIPQSLSAPNVAPPSGNSGSGLPGFVPATTYQMPNSGWNPAVAAPPVGHHPHGSQQNNQYSSSILPLHPPPTSHPPAGAANYYHPGLSQNPNNPSNMTPYSYHMMNNALPSSNLPHLHHHHIHHPSSVQGNPPVTNPYSFLPATVQNQGGSLSGSSTPQLQQQPPLFNPSMSLPSHYPGGAHNLPHSYHSSTPPTSLLSHPPPSMSLPHNHHPQFVAATLPSHIPVSTAALQAAVALPQLPHAPPPQHPPLPPPQHPVEPAPENNRYILSAFRVGMLALETLARRVHDDRPQTKYAKNPPYGEDVKWLMNIAMKLGTSYLHQVSSLICTRGDDKL